VDETQIGIALAESRNPSPNSSPLQKMHSHRDVFTIDPVLADYDIAGRAGTTLGYKPAQLSNVQTGENL